MTKILDPLLSLMTILSISSCQSDRLPLEFAISQYGFIIQEDRRPGDDSVEVNLRLHCTSREPGVAARADVGPAKDTLPFKARIFSDEGRPWVGTDPPGCEAICVVVLQ